MLSRFIWALALLLFNMLLTNMENCYAQLLFNKDQTIYIGPDLTMSVNGSVLNDGIIENNGELSITGDWDNAQQYRAEKGVMVLIGANQQINHRGGDIYELVIDGTGEKLFTSNANILGRLYLENGYLTPGPEVKVMAKSGASITDGYAGSFINGPFYHEGSGKKLFPIGKNRNYNPVTAIVVGKATVGFEVFEPNRNPYFSFELKEVFKTKYWQKTLVSGEINNGSLITLPLEWYNGAFITAEEVVIAGADEDGNYKPLIVADYSGSINRGIITSALSSSQKFFSLGLLAESPEERTIYIPNAFAPGHSLAQENGEDDRIKIYGEEISSDGFLFRIYNRWGVLVYESTSYQEASTIGWDGINQKTGKLESIGSFKFMLKGKYNSGRAIEKTGSIHLIQ